MAVLNYLFFKYFVDPGCQAASKKRCYDEDPKDSHGCAVSGKQADQSGAEGAGRVDAGSGKADAQKVNQGKGKADDKAAEMAVAGFGIRYAENGKHEEEGQKDLDKKACPNGAVKACKTVGSKSSGGIGNAGSGKDKLQQCGSDGSS